MYKFADILTELSQKRTQLANSISTHEHTILVHSLKLLLASESNKSRNHWKQEIWAAISAFAWKPLKGRNKKPNKSFYWVELWDANFDPNPIGNLDLIITELFQISLTLEQLELVKQALWAFYDQLCSIFQQRNIKRDDVYYLCNVSLASLNWSENDYLLGM